MIINRNDIIDSRNHMNISKNRNIRSVIDYIDDLSTPYYGKSKGFCTALSNVKEPSLTLLYVDESEGLDLEISWIECSLCTQIISHPIFTLRITIDNQTFIRITYKDETAIGKSISQTI